MTAVKKLYLGEQKGIFVTNLQRLICEKNISEAELARQTNIPQPTLHKILTGKTSDPRASTLSALAKHFNVSIDGLFHGQLSSQHQPPKVETQSIAVISWKNCLKASDFIRSLTPINWEHWVILETLTPNSYGLISKPSMDARIPQGSILVVDPNCEEEDGDLVVVHYPNTMEATLRELSIDGPDKLLLPINPRGNVELLDKGIKILGVVVQSRFTYSSK